MNNDAVAPHSVDAEESIIGALLIDPNVFCDVSARLAPLDFYLSRCRDIYRTIEELYNAGNAIDVLTVTQSLEDKGRLGDVGGPTGLMAMISRVPSSQHVMSYVDILVEKSLRRKMLRAANEIAVLAYRDCDSIDMLLANASSAVENIVLESSALCGTGVTPSQIGNEFKHFLRDGIGKALTTGIPELDRALGGLFQQEVITIATRPGIGKTALALQIARTVAFSRHVVLFVSLEMQRLQLWSRMVVPASGLDWRDVRMGNITDTDLVLLSELSNRLEEALKKYLIIDDTIGATVFDIRRSVAQHRPELVIIDQLPDVRWHESGVSPVIWYGEAIKFFKAELARRYNIPVIVVHQLSRKTDDRADHKPELADLRWSGEIEQRSDIVALGYREDLYTGREPGVHVVPFVLDIAKHRQGENDVDVIIPYDLQAQWFGDRK